MILADCKLILMKIFNVTVKGNLQVLEILFLTDHICTMCILLNIFLVY